MKHLDDETLRLIALKQLSGPAYDADQEHLLGCEECCYALRDIRVFIAETSKLTRPAPRFPSE